MPISISRFFCSRYSTRSLATFLPVCSASSLRALLQVGVADLDAFRFGDFGHQQAGAHFDFAVLLNLTAELVTHTGCLLALAARPLQDFLLGGSHLTLDQRGRKRHRVRP